MGNGKQPYVVIKVINVLHTHQTMEMEWSKVPCFEGEKTGNWKKPNTILKIGKSKEK